MRRLVDIDEVIRIAKDTFSEEDVRKIAWVLCYTPTAYDVEKVVAELEKASVGAFDIKTISFRRAVDIVRKGGADERT
jgi:tRNA A58 N-methylase Trm61